MILTSSLPRRAAAARRERTADLGFVLALLDALAVDEVRVAIADVVRPAVSPPRASPPGRGRPTRRGAR